MWLFILHGNYRHCLHYRLTAFVLRVFHEARPYVYVDDGVLQRAIDWIIQRQNQDGSFNEFGNIFDPEMRVRRNLLPTM